MNYSPRCNHGVSFGAYCGQCAIALDEAFKRNKIMPEPISLVTTRSDQDIVNDLRKRVVEAYKPILDLCTEANNDGFALQVNVGPDVFGRFQISQLQIIKVYK